MKKIHNLILTSLLTISFLGYSQLGIGTNAPEKAAILELKTTTKGFLLPRMLKVERDAIPSPIPEGLVIYCTDCATKSFSFYNGTEWINISSSATPISGLEIESCVIAGTFMQGNGSISRNLMVTYKQNHLASIGLLTFDTSNVTLSGVGALGLAVGSPSPANYTFNSINETTTVTYPIFGTPTTLGTVTADIDYASLAQCTSQTTVDSGTVTLDLSDAIDIVSYAGTPGTINNTTNTINYSIPYTGGTGINSITFENTTSDGATISIASASISNASGTLNVSLTASPSYNVPVQSIGSNTALFSINVLVNGTFTGSIAVNAIGIPTTVMSTGSGTLTFMAHNLGADYSLAPDVPIQDIHGNYYQWGTLAPVADTSTPATAISGWNTTPTLPGDWTTASKTANDPCPSGFRVPTAEQWIEVVANNIRTTSGGAWSNDGSFDKAVHFTNGSNKLTLPAAGNRHKDDGTLNDRGGLGLYWSSNSGNAYYSKTYEFDSSLDTPETNYNRLHGLSVRCVLE